MSKPQNSFAKEADRNLRDGREATAQRDWAMHDMAMAFDSLQPGDSLASFGVAGVVRKKNRKSVVSSIGTRWTRHELTGVR